MDKKLILATDKGGECRDMLEILRFYGADENLQKAAILEYWFPNTLGESLRAVAYKGFLGMPQRHRAAEYQSVMTRSIL